jgi:hypothetical protein
MLPNNGGNEQAILLKLSKKKQMLTTQLNIAQRNYEPYINKKLLVAERIFKSNWIRTTNKDTFRTKVFDDVQ